jgi:hypothetical protein
MRRLLLVLVGIAAACNSADFTPATPKDCRKTQCDCEEDPNQPTCRGFTGPEGGIDADTPPETGPLDASRDSGDAGTDAADAGDADDQ